MTESNPLNAKLKIIRIHLTMNSFRSITKYYIYCINFKYKLHNSTVLLKNHCTSHLFTSSVSSNICSQNLECDSYNINNLKINPLCTATLHGLHIVKKQKCGFRLVIILDTIISILALYTYMLYILESLGQEEYNKIVSKIFWVH